MRSIPAIWTAGLLLACHVEATPAPGVTPDGAPDEEEPAEPYVGFIEPDDNATVDNPVRFEIASTGVDSIEIFADETYSLGGFDPADRNDLTYTFSGTGYPRSLHVVGRKDGEDVTRAELTITVNP